MNAPAAWVVFAAVAVAGCAHGNQPLTAVEPAVKPGLIMLTADQAEQRGIDLEATAATTAAPPEAHDVAAVILPADVKAYALGRQVDPGNPNVLHEAHVVYRRETSSRWRLQAPASQQILVGPRITDSRQELHPLLDQELNAYLGHQRRAAEASRQTVAALLQAVEALTRQQQHLAQELAAQKAAGLAPEPEPAGNRAEPASEPDQKSPSQR